VVQLRPGHPGGRRGFAGGRTEEGDRTGTGGGGLEPGRESRQLRHTSSTLYPRRGLRDRGPDVVEELRTCQRAVGAVTLPGRERPFVAVRAGRNDHRVGCRGPYRRDVAGATGEINDDDVTACDRGCVADERGVRDCGGDARPVHQIVDERADLHAPKCASWWR